MKKLLLLLAMSLIAVPTYAATIYETEDMNFDFYASLRVIGNFTYEEKAAIGSDGTKSNQTFSTATPFRIQNNSRFGFRYGYKNFKAVLEMALSTETGTTDLLRFRLAYAQYDVNDNFGFAIGKMSLAPTVSSGNVFRNDTLSGYGALSSSRRGAARISFYSFEFNIVSLDSYSGSIEKIKSQSQITNSMPSFLLAYKLPKFLRGKVWAQYLNVTLEDDSVTSPTETTFQSWLTGLRVAPKFGNFTLLASAYIGENVGFLASTSGAIISPTGITNSSGALISSNNSMSKGFLIAPRYAINKGMTIEVGYGMANANVYGQNNKEDGLSAYIVYKYKPIKYLTLAAEVLYLSLKTRNTAGNVNKTETVMAGIQARFDF